MSNILRSDAALDTSNFTEAALLLARVLNFTLQTVQQMLEYHYTSHANPDAVIRQMIQERSIVLYPGQETVPGWEQRWQVSQQIIDHHWHRAQWRSGLARINFYFIALTPDCTSHPGDTRCQDSSSPVQRARRLNISYCGWRLQRYSGYEPLAVEPILTTSEACNKEQRQQLEEEIWQISQQPRARGWYSYLNEQGVFR